MELIDKLSQNEIDKIDDYNANSKLNSFLYINTDCHNLYKEQTGKDRWALVTRCNQIEKELIPFANSLDGVKVEVVDDRTNKTYRGVIKHSTKREFEGRIYDNGVSFRKINRDSGTVIIALWVDVVNDKLHSHLYTINNIIIIEEPLERDPEDPSYE